MVCSKDFLLVLRLGIRQFYWCVAFTGLLGGFYTIVIHKHHFCIGKRNIKTAKCIYCSYHCIKINSYVIRNFQIKHGIQHGNGLFRTAICVSRICLGVSIISNIQKSITIYGSKLHLFGIIINTCNDNGITVLCIKRSILGTLVDSEKCISCIARHLWCCHIRNNLALIQLRCLNLVQSGINLSIYIQSANKQQKTDNFHNKQSSPLFSTRSCHFSFLSQYAFLLMNPLKIVINIILISSPTVQFSI